MVAYGSATETTAVSGNTATATRVWFGRIARFGACLKHPHPICDLEPTTDCTEFAMAREKRMESMTGFQTLACKPLPAARATHFGSQQPGAW